MNAHCVVCGPAQFAPVPGVRPRDRQARCVKCGLVHSFCNPADTPAVLRQTPVYAPARMVRTKT